MGGYQAGFFDDGLRANDEKEESLVQRLLEEDKDATTATDIVTEKNDKELGDDTGDVPNIQKQGFFQGVLGNLPGALGVLISKDPGKALQQVLESRQAYIVEQERRAEREKVAAETKEYRGKILKFEEGKERRAAEQFKEELSYKRESDQRKLDFEEMKFKAEHGVSVDVLELRQAELGVKIDQFYQSEANAKARAEFTAGAAMDREVVRGTNQIGYVTASSNLRTAAEKEMLDLQTKRTMMYAGATTTQAGGIVSKLRAGVDLDTEERAIFDKAMTMNFDDDSGLKAMYSIGEFIAKEHGKVRVDYTGQPVEPTPVGEILTHVTDGMNMWMEAVGSAQRFVSTETPEEKVTRTQERTLNIFRLHYIELMKTDPEQAEVDLQQAVIDGHITQQMADALRGFSVGQGERPDAKKKL